jgi:hypothetical protein
MLAKNGKKPTKKLQEQYHAAQRTAKRFNQSIHKTIFNLPKTAITESTYYRTNGGVFKKIQTRSATIGHKLTNEENAIVIIKTLSPLITNSDKEISINEYTTIQLSPQDRKTIAQLLEMQMKPFKIKEDYVVMSVTIETVLHK